MRKSIASVSLSGTLEKKIAAVAQAGFDGIEIFDQDLISCRLTPEEIAASCAEHGITVEIFQPFRDGEGVPEPDFPRTLRRFARKLDIMRRLGARKVLVCSNALPSAVNDPDLSGRQLRSLGDLAAQAGVTIGFEALAWGTHINRVAQAWDVVKRADHPSVGLVVDTFHLLAMGDTPDVLDEVDGSRIVFLQIADAPHMSLDTLEWSRHHRCFPGQGTFDVTGVVAKVVERGFDGPLSLEVFSDVVRAAKAQATAWDAMRSLKYLEEQIGVSAFHPTPEKLHVGFVEIAVEQQDSEIARTLAGLGFAAVGRHRTKDVVWWRNGDVHILLNAEPPVAGGKRAAARPLPFITSLGMELADHEGVAQRTKDLAWAPVTRSRGVGETALHGVETPSHVEVFLSGVPGTTEHWANDFDPLPAQPAEDFQQLDHFGIVVGRDAFESEVSFFRTILGIIPGPVSEFMEPNGRLRSRVLNPAGDDFHVVLNYGFGLGGRRWPGVNQIAYQCRNLLDHVAGWRAAGVRLITIPSNYYDDLDARFGLEPEFLERLRDSSVLYDEDADGAFIHTYTELIAGQFYLEIVERFNGYRGFGVPNTHVRIFSQHAPI